MKTKEQIALQEQESESIKISGAEAVIRCLLAEGVDLIYGYPGGAIMPVYDELYKFDTHHRDNWRNDIPSEAELTSSIKDEVKSWLSDLRFNVEIGEIDE